MIRRSVAGCWFESKSGNAARVAVDGVVDGMGWTESVGQCETRQDRRMCSDGDSNNGSGSYCVQCDINGDGNPNLLGLQIWSGGGSI